MNPALYIAHLQIPAPRSWSWNHNWFMSRSGIYAVSYSYREIHYRSQ